MGSLPKEARTKVEINELRVARGIVDSSSVDVEIDGRKPGEMPDILAQLERLPPDVEDKLTHVEGVEGRLLLLPEENLKKLREPLSLDGTSFNVPDAIPPAVVAAQEYAERLVRAHVRDFDAYPAETRAKWLIETIKRVNKVGKSIHALGEYLAFAAPGKSKTVMDAEELLRDVQAAILKDVYGLEYKEIREKLGMEPLSDEVRPGGQAIALRVGGGQTRRRHRAQDGGSGARGVGAGFRERRVAHKGQEDARLVGGLQRA